MNKHKSQYKIRYAFTRKFNAFFSKNTDFEELREDWLTKLAGNDERFIGVAATALAGLDLQALYDGKKRGSNYIENIPKIHTLAYLNYQSKYTLRDRAIIFQIATILWAKGEHDASEYLSAYDFNSFENKIIEIKKTISHLAYFTTIEEFWRKKGESKESIQEKNNKGIKLVTKDLLKEWLKYEGGKILKFAPVTTQDQP